MSKIVEKAILLKQLSESDLIQSVASVAKAPDDKVATRERKAKIPQGVKVLDVPEIPHV